MKSVVRSFVTLAALGLAGTAGGIADAGQPPPRLEQPPPAAERTAHGFVQILEDALDEVSLRPEQESDVEKLVNHLEPLQAHVDDAESTLLAALADQVQAGRIDHAALDPRVEGYANARRDVSSDIRVTIQALHTLLDPEQRADLADALQSGLHDLRRALLSGERLDEFAQALHLSDSQIQQIRDGLESVRPALEHERSVLHQTVEAFRNPNFSIEQTLPQSLVVERARQRAVLIIDLTKATMELLDASQRDLLAERIRKAAAARADEGAGTPTTTRTKGDERTGDAEERWVAAGRVRRGGVRGVRGGVVVGGAGGFAYGRVRAFPYAAAWGYGW